MKTKTTTIKAPKRKITSMNFSITFKQEGSEFGVSVTGIFPSPTLPTIKALLDWIVSAVNEECGTEFQVKQSEKQTIRELGY